MPSDPTPRSDGRRIALSEPEIRGREWQYVKECLDSGWVSSAGAFVDRFEQEFARRLGLPDAVAVVNGTAALHIALLVAGVQPEDEVLVSTLTFIAPANAVRYVGAWPVLIDAEPDFWQMDVRKAVQFLDQECAMVDGRLRDRRTGRRVGAVLPVHILGHPVDMDPLLEAARRYRLPVIEDATESLGGAYRGRPLGTLGTAGCYSFNGNKLMTTGGGGAIVGSAELLGRARYLARQAKDDPVEFVHDHIGFNYRLTNLQAAVGVAQLEQLDAFVAAKRRTAAFYSDRLQSVTGISVSREAGWATSAYWLFTILVDESRYGMSSRALMRRLAAEGVETRPFWRPVHQQKPYAGCPRSAIQVADRLYRDGLHLPSSVGILEADRERVIGLIEAWAQSPRKSGRPTASTRS